MSEKVIVREVGLRDGLQSLARFIPTEAKTAWADAEHEAGVREIEVTSLVPPKLIPQFTDSEAVVRHALGHTLMNLLACLDPLGLDAFCAAALLLLPHHD